MNGNNKNQFLAFFFIVSLILVMTITVYYLSKPGSSVETEYDGDYIDVVYPTGAKKGSVITFKYKNDNQTLYKVSLDVLDDDAAWVTLKKYTSLDAMKNVTFSVSTDDVRTGTYAAFDFREKAYDFRVLVFETSAADEALERIDFKIDIEASTSGKIMSWAIITVPLIIVAMVMLFHLNNQRNGNHR